MLNGKPLKVKYTNISWYYTRNAGKLKSYELLYCRVGRRKFTCCEVVPSAIPKCELVWRATMRTDCFGCMVIKINLELHVAVSNCSYGQRLLFRMMSHALLHPHNMDTSVQISTVSTSLYLWLTNATVHTYGWLTPTNMYIHDVTYCLCIKYCMTLCLESNGGIAGSFNSATMVNL